MTASNLNSLLASLTPPQREAVLHGEGPLLILAGPGSGKTRVMTGRIARLLSDGVPARRILALTFTNKAADEMKHRVAALAPGEPVWCGTFHRFCALLLRRYADLVGLEANFTIYDADDSHKALRRVLRESDLPLTHVTPEAIIRGIGRAKNEMLGPEEYAPAPGDPLGAVVAEIYPQYQARLRSSNAVDFDDLLLLAVRLLHENPELRGALDERYQHILVDEYQDTNLAQYLLVRALSVDSPNLAVTGDPDQSIYGWRGANLNNILNFEHDYPAVKVVRLEQNYRSTPSVLRVADLLIANNRKRKRKTLFTENPAGAPVRLVEYATHEAEAEGIARLVAEQVRSGRRRPRDFAIFYRMNALSRGLEQALREQGAPYQVVSGYEFFQRKEVKDLLAYLHLLNNPRNDVALERVINTPARSIGASTVGKLRDYANRLRLPLLEAARQAGLIDGLSKRAAVAVARFVASFDRMRLAAEGSVEEALGFVLAETRYQEALEHSSAPEDQERLANIQELLSAAREFDRRHPGVGQLEQFLEESSLVNDVDAWDDDDKVTLMTLHASKGLEFPCVFIVALEDEIMPGRARNDDADRLEEERRLLFVGITRAQQELQLSYAARRMFRGREGPTIPSYFLGELPRGEMEVITPERSTADAAALRAEEAVRREAELARRRDLAARGPAVVRTAAEMLAGEETPAPAAPSGVPPELFHQGMNVTHPEYGGGEIIAMSGEGAKRQAMVRFFRGNQLKTFRLAFSPLRPVAPRVS